MSRVTMQTIADHVGLSKYAVSRSLSGKGGVSETTRKRVERAAIELGYLAPSHLNHARTIQLVLHDHDPVNSEVQLRIHRNRRSANGETDLSTPAPRRPMLSPMWRAWHPLARASGAQCSALPMPSQPSRHNNT